MCMRGLLFHKRRPGVLTISRRHHTWHEGELHAPSASHAEIAPHSRLLLHFHPPDHQTQTLLDMMV